MSTQQYHRQLQLHDRVVELKIIRQKRKTLAIHIFPGQKPVELRVPMRCAWFDIEAFLTSRHDWIYDSISELANQPVEAVPEFKQGGHHYFQGDIYFLKISQGRGKVRLNGTFLEVCCSDPDDPVLVQRQVENFYKRQSLPIFEERLAICLGGFPQMVVPTGLRTRKMRARWGSCSHKGEICLNTLLVQKPVAAIDFVILHELCHLVHFRHDRAFYALLDRAMPHWREAEKLLIHHASAPTQIPLFL